MDGVKQLTRPTGSASDRVMAFRFWTERQLTIHVDGPDGGREFRLGKPYARIGRHGRCEVPLEGEAIPRIGVYLHATEDGIFYVDLASSVRGGASSSGGLDANQNLELGDYRIRATYREGPSPRTDIATPLDEKNGIALPAPVIYVLVEGTQQASVRLARRLTVVGRRRPSTLRLKSEFISATHCIFYWQDERLWIIDLLSSNGTEKRGRRFDVERLRLRRMIKLGDVQLGFARTAANPVSDSATGQSDIPGNQGDLFDLHPPDPVAVGLSDSGESQLSSESSLTSHGDLRDGTSAITREMDAIAEMQQQLERERVAWESERTEQHKQLDARFQELDQHFAEIQSWRA